MRLSTVCNGQVFFDEVAKLSLNLQSKLLHFIETGEVQPLGVTSSEEYDVRIVVATSRDLYKDVEAGNFRADLYYCLNVIPLELPALSERENDTLLLIEYFFKELVREKRLSAPRSLFFNFCHKLYHSIYFT